MKKVLMLAAFAAVTLVACNKDDDNDDSKSNKDLIIGTWESTSYLEVEKDANGNILDTVDYYTTGVEATFTEQGVVSLNYGGFPLTGTYAVSGSNLTMYAFGDTAIFNIQSLTETQMNWHNVSVEDSLTYELTASFQKQ